MRRSGTLRTPSFPLVSALDLTGGDYYWLVIWADTGGARRADVVRAPRASWDRDEWDVALSDGATYRVFRERESGAWFIEGILD